MYHGYPNRATWLFNLHNGDYSGERAYEVLDGVDETYVTDKASLRAHAVATYRSMIRYDLDGAIETVENIFDQAKKGMAESAMSFITDMVDYHSDFRAVDVNHLAEMYADEFMENVEAGTWVIPHLDLVPQS